MIISFGPNLRNILVVQSDSDCYLVFRGFLERLRKLCNSEKLVAGVIEPDSCNIGNGSVGAHILNANLATTQIGGIRTIVKLIVRNSAEIDGRIDLCRIIELNVLNTMAQSVTVSRDG